MELILKETGKHCCPHCLVGLDVIDPNDDNVSTTETVCPNCGRELTIYKSTIIIYEVCR